MRTQMQLALDLAWPLRFQGPVSSWEILTFVCLL